MKRITHISNFRSAPSTVTIGTFDGVHIGHRKLLKTLTKTSKQNNTLSTVLTFFPHPRMILQKDIDLKLINTIDEKLDLLEEMGVDQVVVYPFDRAFSSLSSEEYIAQILVEKLNAKCIIIGYDHRFGRSRKANSKDLEQYGTAYGFETIEIEAQEVARINVSSTKIRKALHEGDMIKAHQYLGRSFSFCGEVVLGNGIGKQIGFPTANINIPEPYKILPKNGVYSAIGTLNGKKHYGMLNIGKRPTVDESNDNIEVHWFDFEREIYGETMTVFPREFIRDQHRFGSLEDLKRQLQSDKVKIRKRLCANPFSL